MEFSRILPTLAILFLCMEAQMGLTSSSLFDAAGDGGQISNNWAVGDGASRASVAMAEEPHRQRRLGAISTYISYGSLRADNTNCPPMSGRSYYLPNCRTATGPVNPYERGCLTITRCVRDTS